MVAMFGFGKKKKNKFEDYDDEDFDDEYDYEDEDFDDDDYEEYDYDEDDDEYEDDEEYEDDDDEEYEDNEDEDTTDSDEEIRKLKSKIASLEKTNKSLTNQANKKSSGASMPAKEKASLEKKLSERQTTIDALTNELSELKDQLASAPKDGAHEFDVIRSPEYRELQDKYAELKAELDSTTVADEALQLTKDDIAEIIMQAKVQAKGIIRKAVTQRDEITSNAESNATATINNAKNEAQEIVVTAQTQADNLVKEANEKATTVLTNAELQLQSFKQAATDYKASFEKAKRDSMMLMDRLIAESEKLERASVEEKAQD